MAHPARLHGQIEIILARRMQQQRNIVDIIIVVCALIFDNCALSPPIKINMNFNMLSDSIVTPGFEIAVQAGRLFPTAGWDSPIASAAVQKK